jgi:NADPH2:quinone reductase
MGKRGRILGIGSAPIVPQTIRRLVELAAEGRIRPAIDRELPLEQAAEAHRAIEARETFGKVVLLP